MLRQRLARCLQARLLVKRTFAEAETPFPIQMELSEHIAKYKTQKAADNFMDLASIPELGNPLNKMGDGDEITASGFKLQRDALDLIGSEPVSPHYENFGMSRKVLFTFAAASGTVSILSLPGNLGVALEGAFSPMVGFFMLLYIYMEGKKSTVVPLLNRFYLNCAANELDNLFRNFQEDMHEVYRRRESQAREQLEYFDLHKEFRAIKREAIQKLLHSEESFLKAHVRQRALNLLEGAQQMETSNRKKITGEVLGSIKARVKQMREQPSQEIKDDAFARALDGIRNGQIDYGKDSVLRTVLDITQTEIQKVNSLTEKQKDEMLCLTQSQIQSLKAADEMAQREFLQKRPGGLEGRFKEHDGFARTMAQW